MDENQIASSINGVQSQEAYTPAYDDMAIARALSGGSQSGASALLLDRSDRFQAQKEQFLSEQKKIIQQQSDPMFRAQQFYSQSGNLAAAIQIGKSRGPALFQMGQELDFGKMGAFAIAPKGTVTEQTQNGAVVVPTRYSAQRRGVMVVPFSGGDESAEAFRTSLGDTQRIMGLLDRLDELYSESGYIGSMSPTVRAAEAKAIESQLVTGVLKTLNGTKSLASVSEGEMNMIMGSIPQSASTWFTNLRGNESVKIGKLRNDLTNVILRAADANGIALIPMKRQAPATREGGKTPAPSGVSL